LLNTQEKYWGETTCTALYFQYFFCGNDKGIIRVFDLQNEDRIKDLKPLKDKQLYGNPVRSLDISQNMEYLVAGYDSGTIAIFDLKSYKLVKVEKQLHDSMVLGVKIVTAVDNTITTISFERDGAVSNSKFSTKGLFNSTKM
jgi:WD40 repeat protein